MAQLTGATLSVTFALNVTDKNFILTDTSDFTTPSVPEAGAVGILKLTNPSGSVIYENAGYSTDSFVSPDITISTSKVAIVNPLIPINTDGTPVNGTYLIEYKLFIPANGGDPDTIYPFATSPNFTYKSPAVDLEFTVNLAQPLLTSTDITGYTVDNVNPDTITRAHSIQYPPTVSVGDVTGTGVTLITSEFYSLANEPLQHSSTLTTDLTYTYTAYLVIDQVTGNAFIDIVSGANICAIYCCLRSQWKRVKLSRTGSPRFKNELEKLTIMEDLAGLIDRAIACGKDEDVNEYTQELLDIGNCTADCGCSDDSGEPQLVTGANPIEAFQPSVKTFTPTTLVDFTLDVNTLSKYWETQRAGNDTAYFELQWTITPTGTPASIAFDIQEEVFGNPGFIMGNADVSGTIIPIIANVSVDDATITITRMDGNNIAGAQDIYLTGEYEIKD